MSENATPTQLNEKIWVIVEVEASLEVANLAIFEEHTPRVS